MTRHRRVFRGDWVAAPPASFQPTPHELCVGLGQAEFGPPLFAGYTEEEKRGAKLVTPKGCDRLKGANGIVRESGPPQ